METTPTKHETTPKTAQSFSNRSSNTKPMSAILKERLKRTRRSFTSPLSVVKRLKIEDDNQPQTSQQENSYHNRNDHREINADINQNDTSEQRDRPDNTARPTEHDLIQQCEELRKEVKQKSETLRRLKMVKIYRRMNDLTQLQRLIEKWRSCAQSVLYELQNELPTECNKITLSQLIDNLGLDDNILHFNRTEDDFTDT